LPVPNRPDRLFRHARSEAIFIALFWLACTIYCCAYCYIYGYITPSRPLTERDVKPIWGVPSWVFWGVFVPWLVCGIVNVVFSAWFVADDDLGEELAAPTADPGGTEADVA
jgi:hypothetical protein